MVWFAAAVLLSRKLRDVLEPEHISSPVHRSSGEAGMRKWGGQWGGKQRCSTTWPASGGEAGQPEETALEKCQGEHRKPAQQTHSLHTQHTEQADTALVCSHSPAKTAGVICNPLMPQTQLRLLDPPVIPSCRKRDEGVNVKPRAAAGAGCAAVSHPQRRWEVVPCSAPGGVKHLYIEQERSQRLRDAAPEAMEGFPGSLARAASPR